MAKQASSAVGEGVSFAGVSQYFALNGEGGPQVVEALSNINVEVPNRQFCALVGGSGCGKTTLLNIAAGLYSPQVGEVRVNGGLPQIGRQDVAYMPARDSLLPWRTILQNIEYGLEIRGMPPKERRERALKLLHAVGLSGYSDAYRSHLSHGMRQRAALARTFALDSPILLMDEPFGALDVHLKIQLGALLLSLWESDQRTILFVTHDLQEAVALADRVIVMGARPGRVVGDVKIPLPRPRSPEALQTDEEFHRLYREIWGMMSSAKHD